MNIYASTLHDICMCLIVYELPPMMYCNNVINDYYYLFIFAGEKCFLADVPGLFPFFYGRLRDFGRRDYMV